MTGTSGTITIKKTPENVVKSGRFIVIEVTEPALCEFPVECAED